jgi:predicted DNA-binding transcriptional regulator YafY
MLETSARLLRLLSLLQTPREWPGPELADRLGVSTRTIRNDVERLRTLGYPVDATRGAVGGYRLGAGAAMPPLLLDDEEAVAIAVSLRTAAGGAIAGIEETALRALTKLQQVLPSRLGRRVDALQSYTVSIGAARSGPTVDGATLALLAAGCRDGERTRFGYLDHVGTSSSRSVEPHRLVNWGRRWYLLAWDLDRDDWRTFRVDRIEAPAPTGRRFHRADPPDLAALVSRSISVAPYRWQAQVRVQAGPDVVAALVPPTVGWVEEEGAGCRLHLGADDLDLLIAHLIGLRHPFEVLHPPELRSRVRELAATMLTAHPE